MVIHKQDKANNSGGSRNSARGGGLTFIIDEGRGARFARAIFFCMLFHREIAWKRRQSLALS